MANETEADIPVLADGAIIHINLHQRQLVADALSVTHSEIKRRTHDQNHISFGECITAGAIEMMRIARRQQSTAATVEVTGDIQTPQKRNGFFMSARSPHLLPVQNRRPLG